MADSDLRTDWKRRILAVLGGDFRLGLVWPLQGSVSLIWYWGKSETGFATGRTPEEAADRVLAQVFGGL